MHGAPVARRPCHCARLAVQCRGKELRMPPSLLCKDAAASCSWQTRSKLIGSGTQSDFSDLRCPPAYLDQVSDARRRPEDDPLVHRHRLLALVLLDGDVAAEEEQRERGHLGAVVQKDLRRKWGWGWGCYSANMTTGGQQEPRRRGDAAMTRRA